MQNRSLARLETMVLDMKSIAENCAIPLRFDVELTGGEGLLLRMTGFGPEALGHLAKIISSQIVTTPPDAPVTFRFDFKLGGESDETCEPALAG